MTRISTFFQLPRTAAVGIDHRIWLSEMRRDPVVPRSTIKTFWAIFSRFTRDIRHISKSIDYGSNDLVVARQIDEGEMILMAEVIAPCIAMGRYRYVPQALEEVLRVLEITAVLTNDVDCEALALDLRKVFKEAGDRTFGRRREPIAGWVLCAHTIPAAWFAVRPREI